MVFRVRLNHIDWYSENATELDPPLRPVSIAEGPSKVPIIRVYGTTVSGERVCAHIHGAFPYIYAERRGAAESVQKWVRKLRSSIDYALHNVIKKGKFDRQGRIHQYVAAIVLVQATPFYGYHVGCKLYCKIYLYDPRHMTRLVKLLSSNVIFKRNMQSYEAHLGFIHQFMIDYNLYGCDFIDCHESKVKFRRVHDDSDGEDEDDRIYGVDPKSILSEATFPTQSYSGLEVDIQVQHILNQSRISPRKLHHNFEERGKSPPPGTRFVHSLEELWKKHGTDIGPQQLSQSRGEDLEWLQEAQYRERIKELASGEAKRAKPDTYENIPMQVPVPEAFPTAFESTLFMSLFPGNSKANSEPVVYTQAMAEEDVVIDESAMDGVVEDDDNDPDLASDQESHYGEQDEEEEEHPEEEKEDEEDDVDEKYLEDVEEEPEEDETLEEEGYDPMGVPMPDDVDIEGPKSDRPATIRRDHRSQYPNFTQVQNVGNTAPPPGTPAPLAGPETPVGLPTTTPRRLFVASAVADKIDTPGYFTQFSRKLHETPAKPNNINQESTHNSIRKPDSSPGPGSFFRLTSEINTATPGTTRKNPTQGAKGKSLTFRSAKHQLKHLGTKVRSAFALNPGDQLLLCALPPPSTAEVLEAFRDDHSVVYQDPFYGNSQDVPKKPHEYAGVRFRLPTLQYTHYPEFNPIPEYSLGLELSNDEKLSHPSQRFWTVARPPPTLAELGLPSDSGTVRRETYSNKSRLDRFSQIEGPTQKNRFTQQRSKVVDLRINTCEMIIMSLEIHVPTRSSLVPDPLLDPVSCIFWCVQSADGLGECRTGIIAVGDDATQEQFRRYSKVEVKVEQSESELYNAVIDLVRAHDPDILAGYEVHKSSWGYVIERAMHVNGFALHKELSRVKSHQRSVVGKDKDPWGYNKAAAIKVTGRHVINIWRAMKGELNLLGYKRENVVFHVLGRRIPHYSFKDLTAWYSSNAAADMCRVLKYYLLHVRLDLELLEKQGFITRVSEQARLIGIDFFSVLSRGSQLKVESLMFRIAKPESYLLISPSKRQVGGMNAIECKPLIMEPQSGFYTSPVVVLDFQSLYPSVMIAHNYCYSTCLGRIVDCSRPSKLGVGNYKRPSGLLGVCKDDINVAPNGIAYVKSGFRKSLLAKMLTELLETRVMIKGRMKNDKNDRLLQKKLNSWQLALKLIANVTYGYTSASFSGRMPCVEIADSIVQTGRETLEKAIELIHSNEHWGAEVVYGDTDSLFIHLKGKTKAEAFDIGEEIANRVTAANPQPIKLKFEKVYHPCVLLAMKRYVGFKYEYRAQAEPEFDAKGIETVRRDGTPAIQKIVETALKILFRSTDVSQVKEYCIRQWTKIMKEKVSIQDFCFAKEVKLGSYSEGAPLQPGAKLAVERMGRDPRNEPQYGERYPYVVVAGAPGQTVSQRSVEVEWLLHSDLLALDATYYITKKLIPPLERIFNLVGSDVGAWYRSMPKHMPLRRAARAFAERGRADDIRAATLEMWMAQDSATCRVCGRADAPRESRVRVCDGCSENRDKAMWEVRRRLAEVEERSLEIARICRSCTGVAWRQEVACDSYDCPVYYSRVREATKVRTQREMAGVLLEYLDRPRIVVEMEK
ncbi:hypothetical protein EDC01DRAFT_713904 [Geopyxis carbonaria]|nr:hypothetical protein EDC01DRAFT_713904 [Geopyxis carbonaria]